MSWHEQSLAIRLKALGPDHVDLGASYNNIANVLEKQGEYGEALRIGRRGVTLRFRSSSSRIRRS